MAVTCALLLLAFSSTIASAAIVEHSFHVQNLTVHKLCHRQVITVVNGSLPGPTIHVHEDDTLVIHVFNKSPYNLTIHWHGIFQLMSAWADGPDFITQCPIQPGASYTYRFTVTQQEGTLWWHAHVSWIRATVYGALIIRPRHGHSYPFPKPYREVPILLGEWWNANVLDVERQARATGAAPNNSDAYTINGRPGDLYPCSNKKSTYKLKIVHGKTYLLRIINAALNNQLFFKIAHHKLTVVAVDASYTKPYVTDVVLVGPGQTTDVLLKADQAPRAYYMAARPYASAPNVPFDNTTTRGLIVYDNAPSSVKRVPSMPVMPAFNDTPTAYRFSSNLTGLAGARHWVPVPLQVDEHMFVTIGLGLERCRRNRVCQGPNGQKLSASMNNASFVFPSRLSILQAFAFNVAGIYTADFPNRPPLQFDYTNASNNNNTAIIFAPKRTSVKKVRFNATVEMILQDTALLAAENHPMHLHGFNFHVLAQGFGNFDPARDRSKFNLVDPQIRNTIGVPVGGWAAIRFTANNPGAWIMHCHLDVHLSSGFGTVFLVENGPTPATTLPPPPEDLPMC
ncbi:hypothetical protein SAY87_022552 [Trapa incisa]|uniref:Laccase n=1 Tax=Trapa incisa TaxID=236973 RepID=A0AAN7Q4C6_9MYRT|nr:hypothetical protein SAY87_022552 [Trapa incisa]